MEKRKTFDANNSEPKKKLKLTNAKQQQPVSHTQHNKGKKESVSHSPKQLSRNQESGSQKVLQNFWWHSKKVQKLKGGESLNSAKAKASKAKRAGKRVDEHVRNGKGEIEIDKRKALQLKKKRQRKNRLLRKKMNLGERSAGEVLREPRTGELSKVSGKKLIMEKRAEARGLQRNNGKKTQGSAAVNYRTDIDTSRKAVDNLKLMDSKRATKPALSEKLSPQSLQKSGGQKKQKRKQAKKFKKLKNAKEVAEATSGKTKQTGGDADRSTSTSGSDDSNGTRVRKQSKEKGSIREGDAGIDKTTVAGDSEEEVSSNWKALLPIVEKSREAEAQRKKKSGKGAKRNKQPTPSKPDIWFDDVDPSLIKANENAEAAKDAESETAYNPLIRRDAKDCLTKCLAMDCEMVGTGPKGSESILARVSVVNQFGACVFDKYVTPREPVTDYRTFVSGIRPEDLRNKGEDFEKVQKELSDLLKERVVIGHALHNDFKIVQRSVDVCKSAQRRCFLQYVDLLCSQIAQRSVDVCKSAQRRCFLQYVDLLCSQVLYFSHPRSLVRDTSTYPPFKELVKSKRPGLKALTELILKVKVQKGEHNSVEDAQAAMKLYMLHRKQWEKWLRAKTHKPSTKKPPKMGSKTTGIIT